MFSIKPNNFICTIMIVSIIYSLNYANNICSKDENCSTRNGRIRKRQIPNERPPAELGKIWEKIRAEGRWSSWGPWTCDAVCGHGAYFRVRECIPSEDFGVPVCGGRSVERSSKECQMQCPGIDEIRKLFIGPILSEAEKAAHFKTLSTRHGAFKKKVGEMVELDCNTDLTMQFLANYSKSVLYWEINGEKLSYNFTRMSLREYSILGIINLETSDTGVYTCNVKFSKRFRLTILVFSLIVIGQPYDLNVTTNTEIPVTCNSKPFGKLFPGLQARWLVNDDNHVLKDYGLTSAENISEDIITNAKENDTGLWMCVIKDTINKRTWLTNAFYVKVSPSYITTYWRFLQSILQVPRYLAAVLATIIIAAVLLIVAMKWRKKKEKLLMERLEAILKISTEIEKEMQRNQQEIKNELQKSSVEEKEPKVVVKAKVHKRKSRKMKEVTLENKIQKALEDVTMAVTKAEPHPRKTEMKSPKKSKLKDKREIQQAQSKSRHTMRIQDQISLDKIRSMAEILQKSSSTTAEDLKTKEDSQEVMQVQRLLFRVRHIQLPDTDKPEDEELQNLRRKLQNVHHIEILNEDPSATAETDEALKRTVINFQTMHLSNDDDQNQKVFDKNRERTIKVSKINVDHENAEQMDENIIRVKRQLATVRKIILTDHVREENPGQNLGHFPRNDQFVLRGKFMDRVHEPRTSENENEETVLQGRIVNTRNVSLVS